jgi:protein SCO1/2
MIQPLLMFSLMLMLTAATPALAQHADMPMPAANEALTETTSANEALGDVDFKQNLGQQVPPDVSFIDQNSQTVTLGQIAQGKPVLLMMGYFHCMVLCDQVIEYLAYAVDRVPFDAGKDYQIVFISIDPRETPRDAQAKLKAMVSPDHTQGWHLLTGKPDAIKQVASAIGFKYAHDPKTNQFAHPAGAVVLTPDLVISRYLYGLRFAPRDVKFALMDASQGKVGSLVDRVLLRCYCYDPTTGKYGVTIMASLDVAAIATVIALGTLVILLGCKHRRVKLSSEAMDFDSPDPSQESTQAKDKA